MTTIQNRSQSQALLDGATDGTLKKPRPDTVPDIFDTTEDSRIPLYRPRSGWGMAAGEVYNDDVMRGVVAAAKPYDPNVERMARGLSSSGTERANEPD